MKIPPKKRLRRGGAKLDGKLSKRGELAKERDSKARHKSGEDIAQSRREKSLVEFFRESPLVGVELDLERDREHTDGPSKT
jgi:hypothetical protein